MFISEQKCIIFSWLILSTTLMSIFRIESPEIYNSFISPGLRSGAHVFLLLCFVFSIETWMFFLWLLFITHLMLHQSLSSRVVRECTGALLPYSWHFWQKIHLKYLYPSLLQGGTEDCHFLGTIHHPTWHLLRQFPAAAINILVNLFIYNFGCSTNGKIRQIWYGVSL